MKKSLIKVAAVMLMFGGALTVPQAANAAGCAKLTKTAQEGSTNYAWVKNVCSSSKSMRPTVNNWPDPNCKTVGAGDTVKFRTGGSFAPKAEGATVC